MKRKIITKNQKEGRLVADPLTLLIISRTDYLTGVKVAL